MSPRRIVKVFRRRPGRSTVALLAVLAVLWLGASAAAAWRLTHRPRAPFPEPAPAVAWARLEERRLATRDGEELGAWLWRGGSMTSPTQACSSGRTRSCPSRRIASARSSGRRTCPAACPCTCSPAPTTSTRESRRSRRCENTSERRRGSWSSLARRRRGYGARIRRGMSSVWWNFWARFRTAPPYSLGGSARARSLRPHTFSITESATRSCTARCCGANGSVTNEMIPRAYFTPYLT